MQLVDQFVTLCHAIARNGGYRNDIPPHRIRISEILPWDRKSFLAHQKRISEILS